MRLTALLIICFIPSIICNTEKTIFVAPWPTRIDDEAAIDNLVLASLNPAHLTLRTYLNASFPSEAEPRGSESWFLLEGLTPGQRHEVRICWAAIQPTEFWLETYELSAVFASSDLSSSFSSYAHGRHDTWVHTDLEELRTRRRKSLVPSESLLVLRINAAANYFSLNETLMHQVPPVLVDIILDPYFLNALPQSLLPTAAYLVILAGFAFFLSLPIANALQNLAVHHASRAKTKKDK